MSGMFLRNEDIKENKAIALLFYTGKLSPKVQSRTLL